MTCLPLRPHVSGRQGFSHRALPMGTQTLTLVRGENGHSCQMEMIGGLMASCSKKSVHVHRRGLEASLPLHVFPSKGLFCTPLTPHSCPVTEAGRAPSHPVVLPSPQTEAHQLLTTGSPLLDVPSLTSPRLLGCTYDTALTHASLHASSHGSTQLAICQVQSHHWAEGPRVIFCCSFVCLFSRLIFMA